MKKFSKRLLTFVLACAMVFGLSGMTAFAAEADGQDAHDGIVTFADESGYDRPEIDSAPDGTYQEYDPDFQWYIDLGSEADTYVINTAEELAAFSAIVNNTDLPDGVLQNSFAGQTVTLGQDIVMNDPDAVESEDGEWGGTGTPTLTVSEEAYAFTPIGNMRFNPDGSADTGYSFEGTFDGDGHTIENLFVFSGLEEDAYDGLFGVVGSENYAELEEEGEVEEGTTFGCLKNFTVTGLIWVRGGEYGTEIDFAGGVCAKLSAGAAIEDVTNQARIYAPYTDNVGGIVGFAGTPHAMGGSAETGGGTNTNNPGYEENPSGYNTFVLRCVNEGAVSAFHKNGGIAGENAATIKYCYNTGWIQCRRNYSGIRMGGIVGTNGNNGFACEESVIAYCYNAGAISNDGCDDLSKTHVSVGDYGVRGYAGITGSNYGGDGKNEVYNCYNIGAIPAGYRNYNSIASYLDGDSTYGYGAYVSIRNNYTLDPADDIVINWGTSTEPQETGYTKTSEEFTKDTYGDDDILTCLGPYFVHDENGDNPKYEGFPILWWQDEDAELPTLTELTIAKEPDKTTGYINGDTFDATGMVVYAEYDNGARALLTPDIDYYNYWYTRTDGYHYQYEVDSGEYMDGSATYVEITYTDGGTTVSAWQPVNGAEPSIGAVNVTSDMTGSTKTYDGEAVTLTAEATDIDPAGAELTYQWYKEDDAIEGATESTYTLEGNVSDSGTYQCVVTAAYGGAESEPKTGSIEIEIEKAEPNISFAQSEVAKMVGDDPFTNELTGVEEGATITYTSSEDAIASVDSDGKVTIHATGDVTITANVSETENYTAASASYLLTIAAEQPPVINSVTITSDIGGEANTKAYDGEAVTLTAEAEFEPASADVTYQWYTVAEDGTETKIDGAIDNELILDGDVSDSGTYKCVVTATTLAEYGSVSGDAEITITITAAAQEISFEESTLTKAVGDEPFTNTLIETTVDTAGGATISYESSDETIAMVDEDGQVTILAEGNVTITATVSATANYEEATASYDLTIEAAPAPTVDKTALEEAINTAESLTASDYTEDSWEALEEVLAMAEGVDADPEAQQAEVDAAAEALETAMDNLEAVPADKETLEEEIAAAEDLVESDYTPESWAALQDALAAAEAANADPDALQSEVEAAEEALKTAMDNLVTLPVDKAVLEAAIADTEGLNESDYTEDSWNALMEALAAAKAVDENNDATQSEVNQAAIALIDAIANLEGAVDKSNLMEEYVDALDLSKSDYTPESWAPFEKARGDALDVLLDVTATQEDVEKAADVLKTAMDNLVKKDSGGTVKNGLCQITAGKEWGYYVNDEVDTSYTGFASNDYGDWYVVNGYIHFDQNTVAKDTTGKNGDKGVGAKGTWYYVVGNQVQHDFTGLAHYKNQNGWWYITKGEVDFTHNGVDKNQNGWWYVKNGKVEFGHNGVDKNQNGWWYITGGKVQFGFTGLANYKNANGWWYIKEGKVDFTHNGVDKNRYGWWYVSSGKVDFGYNGRASNQYGTWNIVNGKVVF